MNKLANVIKKANFTSKFMSKVEDIATELGYDVTTDYQYGLQTKYTIIISKDYKTYLVVEVIETNEAYDYINIYRANGEQPFKQWQRYATNFDVKFFLPILDYITDELTPVLPNISEAWQIVQNRVFLDSIDPIIQGGSSAYNLTSMNFSDGKFFTCQKNSSTESYKQWAVNVGSIVAINGTDSRGIVPVFEVPCK